MNHSSLTAAGKRLEFKIDHYPVPVAPMPTGIAPHFLFEVGISGRMIEPMASIHATLSRSTSSTAGRVSRLRKMFSAADMVATHGLNNPWREWLSVTVVRG